MVSFNRFFPEFFRALGLQSPKKFRAFGRRTGFPVAAEFNAALHGGGIAVQARFDPRQAVPRSIPFEPPLANLLAAGQGAVRFLPGGATLSLFQASKRIKAGEVLPATEAFLAGLARAGLTAGDACHYCGGTERVELVPGNGSTFAGANVGQMCVDCQFRQASALAEERQLDAATLPRLLATGVPAAVAGAVLWAGIWVGVDAFFVWRGGHAELPVKLSLLVVGLAGALAAWPVSLLRGVAHRGYWLAGLAGLACAAAAFVLGEGLVAAERLWRAGASNWWWPPVDARVAWETLTDGNGLFLFLRGACLVSLLTVAFLLAKPARPAFKL